MHRFVAILAAAVVVAPVTGCATLSTFWAPGTPTTSAPVASGCAVTATAVPGAAAAPVPAGDALMAPMPVAPVPRWTINASIDEVTANATTALFDLQYCDGHTVTAVDAASGAPRWKHQVPRDTGECSLVRSGRAMCWDSRSGKPRESGATLVFLGPDAESRYAKLGEPGSVEIAATGDGFVVAVWGKGPGSVLYAFSEKGDLRWRIDVASEPLALDVSDTMVVVRPSSVDLSDQVFRLSDGRRVLDEAALNLDAGTASVQFNTDGFTVAGRAGATPWVFFFDRDGRRRAAAPGWRHVQRFDVTARCRRVIVARGNGDVLAAVDPASAVVQWEQPAPHRSDAAGAATYECVDKALVVDGRSSSQELRSLDSGAVLRTFDPSTVEVMGTDGAVVVVSTVGPKDDLGYVQNTLTAYSVRTGDPVWSLPMGRYTTGRAFPAAGTAVFGGGRDAVTRMA